jgi:L-ribulokinase
MIGMTLSTKPEEMYRALIEATAYGNRVIIETFRESGVPVNELYACGGIASKDDFMMQIYADVTNMDLRISASDQAPALGAAMFAAVAAGAERGGYASIVDAAAVMGKVRDKIFRPIPENVTAYDRLYAEYKLLHDFFGRGGNDVMKRLKLIRSEAKGYS